LEGLTRNSVMEIALDMGYKVEERDITRAELYIADEVFMTGTAAEVLPIRMIDDLAIGEGKAGPLTAELQAAFSEIARGRNRHYIHWLDMVE